MNSSLRDRLPRTSQKAVNRIAHRLSEKPNTAGTSLVHVPEKYFAGLEAEDNTLYTLGQSYGGGSNGNLKSFITSKGRNYYPQRGNSDSRGNGSYKHGGRSLRPQWMRGVRRFFVWWSDQRANQLQSRDEVTMAIKKMKERHPKYFITIEDLDAVYHMTRDDYPIDNGEGSDSNYAEWAEDD